MSGTLPVLADSVARHKSLPVGAGGKLIPIKINSLLETDAADAVKLLQAEHIITALDVAIAKSGIANYLGPVIAIRGMRSSFEVDTLGPPALFQAAVVLLEACQYGNSFVMSTAAASIGNMLPMPAPA
ncbi:hypothetical protein FIBSPDRAFT_903668 [Athelia psychrophila]|uniref:Uncharacterized protein n=1 Tax=Athelia psychrophila TaxID=1759441 RepID=A0A167VPC7_9AGAM|nr:hypothetical protein FIBSPDRAFT_903668 [Fibularhizoctonia sp. CBS 109695]